MDLTDTPDEIREAGEERPDFDAWDDLETLLWGESTCERMLAVIMQLRDPAKVSTVAEYRERFGAETPDAVSLLDASCEKTT